MFLQNIFKMCKNWDLNGPNFRATSIGSLIVSLQLRLVQNKEPYFSHTLKNFGLKARNPDLHNLIFLFSVKLWVGLFNLFDKSCQEKRREIEYGNAILLIFKCWRRLSLISLLWSWNWGKTKTHSLIFLMQIHNLYKWFAFRIVTLF